MSGIGRCLALPGDLPGLARAAAAEGFGMVEVLAREWQEGTQRFAGAGEALFAAREGSGALVGIGGITRDPSAEALRMRRFYVHPRARRAGVGRALAGAALEHARGAGVVLVRLRAPAGAARFWESLGFAPLPPGEAGATHALHLGR